MILLIDNYDSFTYNLYQLISVLGGEVEVHRNDDLSVDAIRTLQPQGIVISPGPGGPSDAGISSEVLMQAGPHIPMLGVCLGHQCMGATFGAQIMRAPQVMHGKISQVHHGGYGVFAGLPTPFDAVRYHSLTVDPDSLPDCLEVTARTADGTIMGLRHRQRPIQGVQFHPESVLTKNGPQLMRNFLLSCGESL